MCNNPYWFVEKKKIQKKISSFSKGQLISIILLITILLAIYYVLFGFIIFFLRDYMTFFSYLSFIPSIYLFSRYYWKISHNKKIVYRHLCLPINDMTLLGFYLFKVFFSFWGLYSALIIIPLWVSQLLYYHFFSFVNFLLLYLYFHSLSLIVISLYQQFVSVRAQQIVAWLFCLVFFSIIIYLIYFPFDMTFDSDYLVAFQEAFDSNLTFDYPFLMTMIFLFMNILNGVVILTIFTVKMPDQYVWVENGLSPFFNVTLRLIDKIGILNYGFFYKDMVFIRRKLSDLTFILFPCLISFGLFLSNRDDNSPTLGNIAFLSLWLTSNTTEKLIKSEEKQLPLIKGNFIHFNRMAFEKRTLIISFVTFVVFVWASALAIFLKYNFEIVFHALCITFFLSFAYTQSIVRKAFDREWFSGIVGLLLAIPILIVMGLCRNYYLSYLLSIIYCFLLIVFRRNYTHD